MIILPEAFKPSDLDQIRVENSNGLTVGRVGLSMTLYFKGPLSEEQSRAITSALDAHLEQIGTHLHWAFFNGTEGLVPFKNVAPLRVAEKIADLSSDGDPFFLEAHSGEQRDEAGLYGVLALFPHPRRRRRLGFIQLTLPASWMETHEEGAFQKLLLSWCSAIRPIHGYAGLGLLHNTNYGHTRVAERHLFPFVQRYSGLDYDMPVDHARLCTDGIKCVNWLNILSTELIEKIGEFRLHDSLEGTSATISQYPEGTLIQTGPEPQIGDLQKDGIPTEYQAVARVLKPLRANYLDGIIETPAGIDSKDFGQRWLARFD